MFVSLLLVDFAMAFTVCLLTAKIFGKSIAKILNRLVAEDIYSAWTRYITFALYVVGISGGVNLWKLEQYINPNAQGGAVLPLNQDRWILEIYRTIIETLQSIAWMLLLFFVFALIAYVIVKGLELKRRPVSP
jgi:hypothetical protein